MEAHLSGRQWFMDDDYTIADISMLGWVRNLIGFYGAGDLVAFTEFKSSVPGSNADWRVLRFSEGSIFRRGRKLPG